MGGGVYGQRLHQVTEAHCFSPQSILSLTRCRSFIGCHETLFADSTSSFLLSLRWVCEPLDFVVLVATSLVTRTGNRYEGFCGAIEVNVSNY